MNLNTFLSTFQSVKSVTTPLWIKKLRSKGTNISHRWGNFTLNTLNTLNIVYRDR